MDLWKFVQENIVLIAVAFVSGAMLLWPAVRRSAGGPAVDTLGATLLINKEDALVLDVRQPGETAAGRIVNSKTIPLSDLPARLKEIERWKTKPVIVVCASGSRSAAAASTLRKAGFEKVYNLSGGFGAWQQAGLPVEK